MAIAKHVDLSETRLYLSERMALPHRGKGLDGRHNRPEGIMESRDAPVLLLIAVAGRLYREGLAAALSVRGPFGVAATAGDAQAALTAAQAHHPDLTIVDVALPGALQLMRKLRDWQSGARIVAFATNDVDAERVGDYVAAGACGFVTTQESLDDLEEVIRRALAGELWCSSAMAIQLLRACAAGSIAASDLRQPEQTSGLTCREAQILSLIGTGCSNKQIATKLCISPATVKNHVHHLLQKLQVQSRGQAAALRTMKNLGSGAFR
jgi:two-component system nitrate/nitrite response regulator NarL